MTPRGRRLAARRRRGGMAGARGSATDALPPGGGGDGVSNLLFRESGVDGNVLAKISSVDGFLLVSP
jgi:hypothetical protein